ncbi:glycine zipper 2TM domain-containing protein [Sulfurirhabdus autotrophica]|uniref:Glycine zipper 2TM protein n=1 Tax=Sulfurirhabdus autotrophica TaxID=1706046 RepID=A0A4R3YE40_9PROT|nr:glycine zipper 2TM domain-containing protein [Sulfurirhabdus autotrophica]TCV90417.1 glycine zipper 2TM protein [Sulfurirhabdus autotrophica]
MATQTTKTHPIMIIAAIAVILFSAVGIGAIMGWIPGSASKTQEQSTQPLVTAEQTAKIETADTKTVTPVPEEQKPEPATPPKAETKAEVTKPASQTHREKQTKKVTHQNVAKQTSVSTNSVPAPTNICSNCGVIESVNVIEQAGEGTGLGAVAGGVAGALLGTQIGQGRGTTAATIAGAAGGAFAGHQVEKAVKKTKHFEISVRMEDGSYRTFNQPNDSGLMSGDKVKVVDGAIVRN